MIDSDDVIAVVIIGVLLWILIALAVFAINIIQGEEEVEINNKSNDGNPYYGCYRQVNNSIINICDEETERLKT